MTDLTIHDRVPSQPGNHGNLQKSFTLSNQGEIREFEKNASNQGKFGPRKSPVCYRFILKFYVHTGIMARKGWLEGEKGGHYMPVL